jgi:hypothetical protein
MVAVANVFINTILHTLNALALGQQRGQPWLDAALPL